jgi:hypothetical protein
MLEGWKVHVNVMRHNGRGGSGITTLGAWRTISKDADCLPQLNSFNKASTSVSLVDIISLADTLRSSRNSVTVQAPVASRRCIPSPLFNTLRRHAGLGFRANWEPVLYSTTTMRCGYVDGLLRTITPSSR